MSDLSGQILAGRYEILEKLGEGGYACVWKAKQLQPEGLVAVKILLAEHASDPALVDEFLREAGLYVEFRDDPHVVTILECGSDPETNTHYLVMTLLDGTVEDEVKAGGALDPDKVFRIAEDMGRALNSVHKKNLVHRDVKLSNIMHLASSDRYVLTDFGIGMVQEAAEKTANTQDMSSAVGTWSYASPEQIQAKSKQDIGPRSDFYSLGIALYRAATGEYPFPPNFPQVMIDHVNTPAPDPRAKNPAIPTGLAQIILRCLEKNPDDRYASSEEYLEAVKHARAGGVLEVEDDETGVGGADGFMSLRNLFVGGVAIVIILAAAGFGLFGGDKSQRIAIDTTPTGAAYKLYQGEKMRFSEPVHEGTVPAQIVGLEPGAYALDLALDGYFPVDGHVITIEPGDQEFAPIDLEKAQTLQVTATPTDAQASLMWLEGDGASYAARATPATFEPLHIGQHRLEVTQEGYVPYMDTVVIGDRSQTVSVKLEPTHRVTLWVFSDPAGASVSINGALVSQPTNCEVREIPSGPQTFRLTRDGYAPLDTTVVVNAVAAIDTVHFALTKRSVAAPPTEPGLTIRSTPSGARISLDGRDTGRKTPFTFSEYTPGSVKVALTRGECYRRYEATVPIAAGGAVHEASLSGYPVKSYTINTVPGYVEVYVDNRSTPVNGSGMPPWKVTLSCGTHSLRLRNDKANPPVDVTLKYTVKPGSPVSQLVLNWKEKRVIERN